MAAATTDDAGDIFPWDDSYFRYAIENTVIKREDNISRWIFTHYDDNPVSRFEVWHAIVQLHDHPGYTLIYAEYNPVDMHGWSCCNCAEIRTSQSDNLDNLVQELPQDVLEVYQKGEAAAATAAC
eukprot:m.181001 g.181001  ORF g.181001 m.181001 type:complete len:125 (-) comp9992_c0_seq34:805-1179(-)